MLLNLKDYFFTILLLPEVMNTYKILANHSTVSVFGFKALQSNLNANTPVSFDMKQIGELL